MRRRRRDRVRRIRSETHISATFTYTRATLSTLSVREPCRLQRVGRRCRRAQSSMGGPGIRRSPARVLLRARAREPELPLVDLGRAPTQRRPKPRPPRYDSRARVDVTDLARAHGRLTRPTTIRVSDGARRRWPSPREAPSHDSRPRWGAHHRSRAPAEDLAARPPLRCGNPDRPRHAATHSPSSMR